MMDNSIIGGCAPPGVEMIHTPSIKFRSLLPSEVDVRPAETNNLKATLLLYQDARCAQNILDESVGQFNWQKEYYESNGLLFCKIGIRDIETGEWIWKADTGSKSNIEGDKGQASDAFKRAAVSWGIGRELYTAPRITIPLTEKEVLNGKLTQTFSVSDMAVVDGTITKLTIVDKWGKERFSYSSAKQNVAASSTPILSDEKEIPRFTSTQTQSNEPSSSRIEALKAFCSEKKSKPGIDLIALKAFYESYMKPSKEDPSKTRIEAMSYLNLPKLWEAFMDKRRNY